MWLSYNKTIDCIVDIVNAYDTRLNTLFQAGDDLANQQAPESAVAKFRVGSSLPPGINVSQLCSHTRR